VASAASSAPPLPVSGRFELASTTSRVASNNTWGIAFTEDGFVFGSTANSRPSNFIHIPIRYYRGIGDREPVLPDIADRLDVFPQIDILQVDQLADTRLVRPMRFTPPRRFKEYRNRAAFAAEPTAHVIGQFDLSSNGSGFRARIAGASCRRVTHGWRRR
jgi:hypothetical protein